MMESKHNQPDVENIQLGEESPESDEFISPRNWSFSRKLYHSVMIGIIAFLTPFISSIYVPSTIQVQERFHVSQTLSLLPFPIFVVGITIGVCLAGPLSEVIGRQPIYFCTIPTLGLFSLGAGLSQNFATLLLCRFFAGLSGAPGLTATSASIADVYLPQDRLVPVSVLLGGILAAPPIGGLVGGFIISRTSWRWTQYVSALFAGTAFLAMLGMKETCEAVLRRKWKSQKIRSPEDEARHKALFWFQSKNYSTSESSANNEAPSTRVTSQPKLSMLDILYTAVAKPVHMLFTEPLCAFLSMYIALTFGVIYAFLPAIPYTFQLHYAFTPQYSGLAFSPLIVGYLLSIVFYICYVNYLRSSNTRSTKKSRVSNQLSQTDNDNLQPSCRPTPTMASSNIPSNRKTVATLNIRSASKTALIPIPKAELSLLPAVTVSPLVPISLFWFGWSTGRTHWIVPMLASGVYSFAVFTLFSAGNLYLINAYGAQHGASATSAVRLLSFILGIAFPLFILPMFKALNIGWSMTIFGLISVLLTPVTWVFYVKGDSLRRRSHYAVGG